MSGFWDILLSPTGAALYAAFWIFKILAGAWVVGRLMLILPVRTRRRTQVKLGRLRQRAPI